VEQDLGNGNNFDLIQDFFHDDAIGKIAMSSYLIV